MASAYADEYMERVLKIEKRIGSQLVKKNKAAK